MKKSELINIIREIIKKDIKNEVRKQINEIFIIEGKRAIFSKSAPVRTPKPVVKTETTLTNMIHESSPTPPISKPHQFSKNTTLNEVLNLTRGGIESEFVNATNPYAAGITEENIQQLTQGNSEQEAQIKLEIGAVQTLKSVPGASVDNVPDAVLKNLTRNYSSVLKNSKKMNSALPIPLNFKNINFNDFEEDKK